MAVIQRSIEQCASESFDLIIVGGGIYGIMLSLEAGFRNKRALLLESNDFASATSYNHLRTLHGGLRYLQSLDLPRFFESVEERRWFFLNLPEFVRILPCLMPLYNRGVRRKSIFRIALKINDRLSKNRNRSVVPDRHLPDGYLLSATETMERFPYIDQAGLKGSAVWFDGMIIQPERLVMEVLKWSCELGAKPLNYLNVVELVMANHRVVGVRALDKESDRTYEFSAPVVINAGGPWSREISKQFDKDHPRLFEKYLLLWNILFKKKSISEFSLAVTPVKGSGHTYFLHDWKGRLLVGTGEEIVPSSDIKDLPTSDQIQKTLDEIHSAVPSLSLDSNEIDHVYCGVLPADSRGRLTKREVILNHAIDGGPKGLYSVSGIKFTTARHVARKTVGLIFPDEKGKSTECGFSRVPKAFSRRGIFDFDWMPESNCTDWLPGINAIIREESVIHLDDLIFRRTTLGENQSRIKNVLQEIRPLFPWSEDRWESELRRVLPVQASSGQGLSRTYPDQKRFYPASDQ